MTAAAWIILALFALAAAGALTARAKPIYAAAAMLCAALAIAGFLALSAPTTNLLLPIGLPWTGTHLRLDPLSGFFLILIGLGGAGASLFALGDAENEPHPRRILPFYPAFLAAMALVVVADDAFAFLFGWEAMSLASWALVMAHHRQDGTAHAGFVYLIMAAFSGMTLLLAFGLLAGDTGNYAFDTIRASHPEALTAAIALIVALIGTGSKAGLVPLHVWLPLAHPAAPSHVSALMSGVMTKVAVYGFIRIVFDLLAATPWWAATIVLVLGGVTAVLGVLSAVLERDLKRLLAYSTVENIGIIFIGLGLAMAFRANGYAAGAALALTAALLHALNHTLFKSLLFFGAGAVLHATGLRDLQGMGGLIHRMPRTAVAVLTGCAAIAGLPPLNGFASEWLTFQAILLHPDLPQWGLKLMIPVAGALLALAAALAACCFVRAFGIGFLGRPRTPAAETAHEASILATATMLGFALLCLLAGIFPGALIDALSPVTALLTNTPMPPQFDDAWQTIAPTGADRGTYNGLLVFAFIVASGLLTAAVAHRTSYGARRAPAWDCGFPNAGPDTQYSAPSFAQPIRRVFGSVLFNASDTVDMPPPGDNRPARIVQTIRDPIWDGLYAPLAVFVGWIAGIANRMQFLTIRRYLGFVFAALVLLLTALTLWQ